MYWLIPLAAQALTNKDKQQAAPGKPPLPTYQTPQGMPGIERPIMPEPWQPEPLPPMQVIGAGQVTPAIEPLFAEPQRPVSGLAQANPFTGASPGDWNPGALEFRNGLFREPDDEKKRAPWI